MKSSLLFVVLSCCLLVGSATNLQLNLKNTKIVNDNQWNVITFACQGGSGDYQWDIKNLPKGWFNKDSQIYAPKTEIINNNYYGIKVGIFDRKLRKFMKRSIIFNINNNQVQDCFDEDYNIDFTIKQQFNALINTRVQSRNNFRRQTIQTSSQINSIKFAQHSEIEANINSGNFIWIRQQINNAINSRANCKVITEFLGRILAAINAHISINRGSAETIRQQLFIIEEEIQFIQQQLSKFQGERIVNTDELNLRLIEFRRQLQQLRSKRIQLGSTIKNHGSECDRFQAQIYQKKTGRYRIVYQSYQNEKEKVSKIDSQISELQIKLEALRKERATRSHQCDNYKVEYDSYETQFRSINVKIEQRRRLINDLQLNIPELEGLIQSIEIKILDIKDEIKSGGRNFNSYQKLKHKLQAQRELYQSKVRAAENYQQIFQKIEQSRGQFEQKINNHYDSCYVIQPDPFDRQYQPSIAFITYLKDVFGAQPSSNIRVRFSGTQKLSFKHFSIFSPAWIRIYGIPYSAGYGSNTDVVETQFSCQTSQDASVFAGKIKKITSNVIEAITETGQSYRVHLGGCTKLETITKREIPQIGDQIYWKGSRRDKNSGKNSYNGHHVTCY